MDENLVGYLLNALDPEAHHQVKAYLAEHPESQRRLELLRHALEPLACDRDVIDPPPGLAIRTLARVAEYRCRELPPAPEVMAASSPAASRSWWRRADVLVAACLLVGLVSLLPPGIARLRYLQARQACAQNLHRFHQAFMVYGDHRPDHELPRVGEADRRNVAGIFMPILHDAGLLAPDISTKCPAYGQESPAVCVGLKDLDAMPREAFQQYAPQMAGSYSYALGYRDATGRLFGYHKGDDEHLPIMSDRPLLPGEKGAGYDRDNSPNHDGGQNVLYLGGAVPFVKSRTVGVGGDDIFLNQHRQVAAGLNPFDSVLGASADQP